MPDVKANWIAADVTAARLALWAMHEGTAVAEVQLPPDSPVDRAASALGADPELPVLASGLGTAPCVALPTKVLDLPPPAQRGTVAAIPDLTQTAPIGRMAGATARIAGFLALNPGWDGVICLPGGVTHWALVSAEEVISFQSALSGEMIDALARAPALAPDLTTRSNGGSTPNPGAFASAISDVMSRPERLASDLAALAASAPGRPSDNAHTILQGLVIGAELAATRPYWLGQQIAVIGPPDRARPYMMALALQGSPATDCDDNRMALAGLAVLWRRWTKGAR